MNGPHSAFTVQGKLYHSLATAATPEDGKPETFMQIYTLDDQAAAVRRGELFEGLDPDVLSNLTRMMTEHNPYVHQFKALRDADTPAATLVLRTPEGRTVNGNDARTYRSPSASEVAVLILGDEDGNGAAERSSCTRSWATTVTATPCSASPPPTPPSCRCTSCCCARAASPAGA